MCQTGKMKIKELWTWIRNENKSGKVSYDNFVAFLILQAAALLTLVVIIAINLAVGILPHVDNFAHIGGFMAGFLLGFVLLLRPQFGWAERHQLPAQARVKSRHNPYQYVLCIVALVLLIVG